MVSKVVVALLLFLGILHYKIKGANFTVCVFCDILCCYFSLCSFYVQQYTGSVQALPIPVSGEYKLEVWGAQGTCLYTLTSYRQPFYGGKGGYAVGHISLLQNDILYVCVGQNGFTYDSIHDTELTGGYNIAREYGYNGGGCGHARGGGATHIALNSNRGELKNYSNDKSSVLIVAGGGGGNEIVYDGIGGAGGGSVGGNGTGVYSPDNFSVNNNGKGGTSSAGGAGGDAAGAGKGAGQNGSFGLGGSSVQAAGIYEKGAGGGGGWYGGGGSTAYAGTGGGGSGHLHSSIKNGSMQSGVREGAGYALITWQQLLQ